MAKRLAPYLILDGTAKEALAFYEKALGAQVMGVMPFGEMPADPNHPMPEGVKDRIMHAMMKVGETELMFSDTFPGQGHQIGNHVTIALVLDDAAEARRAFDALSEGGKVDMPLQQTFWSPAYGQVTDKYAVSWQVTTESKG